ncbi:MAG: 23S rRNA (guanosine(2251)-2'-O)-methyltransferase RlmB [Eubacteriales bacterium]|nr:23S rRNA (guanosine(2251)-2'-O)-methyltransferase RlmB [Eubacteriales bacterium]
MERPLDEEPMENNLLVGRNPIREALRAGRDIEKLLVARGELIGSAREIVAMARDAKIVVQEVDRVRLDQMAPNHQGLIAVASAYSYKTVDDMLALAKERGEAPLLVILDGVTDPHNLGAIIRSAECAGAHGVIIPERRAVGLTPAAVKSSAGAVEYLPVAKETNLTRVIERLKKEGVWIYGAAMNGENYRKVDFSGAAAIVIGSEGEGISRLVSDSCDKLVSLPMKGHIDSLNASVAAGILLYAVAGARA